MENKKYTFFILTILAIAVILLVSPREKGNDGTPAINYSASTVYSIGNNVSQNMHPKIWKFGTISMREGDVSHRFELVNDGSVPITINKVYTSCMCTTASLSDETSKKHGRFGMPGHGSSSKANIEIAPGTSLNVDAVFDPAAHGPSGVGLAKRSIYLETDSSSLPRIELNFTAMVTR